MCHHVLVGLACLMQVLHPGSNPAEGPGAHGSSPPLQQQPASGETQSASCRQGHALEASLTMHVHPQQGQFPAAGQGRGPPERLTMLPTSHLKGGADYQLGSSWLVRWAEQATFQLSSSSWFT